MERIFIFINIVLWYSDAEEVLEELMAKDPAIREEYLD